MNEFIQDPKFGESWFNYADIYDLFVDYIHDGGCFVELGCWKGQSISYFVNQTFTCNKQISTTCIDLWGGDALDGSGDGEIFHEFILNTFPIRDKINIIRGDSADSAKMYPSIADVVWIDANHSYEAVCRDIDAWLPKIKPNGIIAGHDIDWSGVFEAVCEKIYRTNIPGYGKVIGNSWVYFLERNK